MCLRPSRPFMASFRVIPLKQKKLECSHNLLTSHNPFKYTPSFQNPAFTRWLTGREHFWLAQKVWAAFLPFFFFSKPQAATEMAVISYFTDICHTAVTFHAYIIFNTGSFHYRHSSRSDEMCPLQHSCDGAHGNMNRDRWRLSHCRAREEISWKSHITSVQMCFTCMYTRQISCQDCKLHLCVTINACATN